MTRLEKAHLSRLLAVFRAEKELSQAEPPVCLPPSLDLKVHSRHCTATYEAQMKITVTRIKRVTLSEFAATHDLEMTVNEHLDWTYAAKFKDAEVMDNGLLRGTVGRGHTPDHAIRRYAELISGQRIVFNAYGEGRRELQVPVLEPWDPTKLTQ